MKSYRDLDIYNVSYKLAVEVHKMTLALPKYELYEEGSQIRRSSKSITSNIVEGYGRKRYKMDFIRFLIFAHSSCDETIVHLNFINDTHDDLVKVDDLIQAYNDLGRKLNSFIDYVEKNWKT
ncbi:four helix bundle protein [Labilibacter sediminis]|nr:four helix bundle protein [Labilibacter sediminis]